VSKASRALASAIVACWAGQAQAAVITFTGGTVTLSDGSTATTNGVDGWGGVDHYEEDGFRLGFLPADGITGNYYETGNDVIHGHWATGLFGDVTAIEITKVGGGTFDLNYFVLTSNTDLAGEEASGNELAWVEGFASNVSTGPPLLLPSEGWGFPERAVYLDSRFDAVDLVRFYVTNHVDCIGMDSFYVDEPAPTPPGGYDYNQIQKTVQNDTGQPVNGFEWLVEGDYTSAAVTWAGPPGSYARLPVSGNTLFRWEADPPTATVLPGASISFSLGNPDPVPRTLKAAWTLDGAVIACVPQISLLDFTGGVPDFVRFENTVNFPPICPGTLVYGGEVSVEWHATEVALAELNDLGERFPIRTDVLPGTYAIPAGNLLALSLPSPPPANASFAVIRVAVSGDPGLVDASIDYAQIELPSPAVPLASRWGSALLVVLLLSIGASATSGGARAQRARGPKDRAGRPGANPSHGVR
jgi:hypothetical protein